MNPLKFSFETPNASPTVRRWMPGLPHHTGGAPLRTNSEPVIEWVSIDLEEYSQNQPHDPGKRRVRRSGSIGAYPLVHFKPLPDIHEEGQSRRNDWSSSEDSDNITGGGGEGINMGGGPDSGATIPGTFREIIVHAGGDNLADPAAEAGPSNPAAAEATEPTSP